jgi:LysR family transcriptional regulator, glycine cleavage system transcriptional activator
VRWRSGAAKAAFTTKQKLFLARILRSQRASGQSNKFRMLVKFFAWRSVVRFALWHAENTTTNAGLMTDETKALRRDPNWLPPLTALKVFEAVGRHGVSRAAAQLNVTPAAIHHQVRVLEAETGVTLFERVKGKGLVLTARGRSYFSDVAVAFDQLYESSRRVRERKAGDRLVVDSLTSFATDFLIPRLPRFIAANPMIELEIITPSKGFGRINFERTGAHVAIRGGGGAGHWPDCWAEMLVKETMFPVCTPSVLNGPIPLEKPSDLINHTLLNVNRTPEGWSDWLREAEEAGHDVGDVKLDQAINFDLIHLSMTAAVQGVGIDLGRAPLVDHYLSSGALVELFDVRFVSTMSYWLICQEGYEESAAFQAFRTWLVDEIADAERNRAAPGRRPD